MKRILVLGAGYMGSEINKHLTDHEVTVVSRLDVAYSNKILFRKYLDDNMPFDYVINCSGFTGKPNVDEGETRKSDCYTLNLSNPLSVVEVCNEEEIPLIHLSSGCIYDGYDKAYTEEDVPNFGVCDNSSTYSKSKHMFEIATKGMDLFILRLRMPFCGVSNQRSYLTKIRRYDTLIEHTNSKSCTEDVVGFIQVLIDEGMSPKGQDIYNVVNSEPLGAKDVADIMTKKGVGNEKWKFIGMNIDKLDIKAPRSNCILDNTKASKIYKFRTEREAMESIL